MFLNLLNIIIISLTIMCTDASFRKSQFFESRRFLNSSSGGTGYERFLENTGETGGDFF